MRKFITIDNSRFPIVIVQYQPFVPTQEEFIQMQKDLDHFANSHENFVEIIDLTHMAFMPSQYRIAQAKWSSKNDSLFAEKKIRLVFVTPSLTANLMLKGVFLISKPGVPHAVVSTINEAISWAEKELAKK